MSREAQLADHIHRSTDHFCRLEPMLGRELHGRSSYADRSDGIETLYHHDEVNREADLS